MVGVGEGGRGNIRSPKLGDNREFESSSTTKILEISHKEFEVAEAETETEEQGTVATVGDTPDVQ